MNFKFGGYEKFVLRDGWLTKGLKIVNESANNPFLDKDAILLFGVGNNMIKSIRYYLEMADLITYKKNEVSINSEIGIDYLMKYDLFFEDVFSIYLYHYLFITNKKYKTIYNLFFNNIKTRYFTKDDLVDKIKQILISSNIKYTDEQIKTDVNNLISLYNFEYEIKNPEDTYISPLTNLKFIKKIDKDVYERVDSLNAVDEDLVYYAIVKCISDDEDGIDIKELANRDNSPMNIFNLSNDTMNFYIDKLRKKKYLRYESTAGLNMIYKIKSISLRDVIKVHYEE